VTLTLRVRIVGLVAGLLAACAGDPEPPELLEVAKKCKDFDCGGNSPLMDGISIAEGNENPTVANDDGVRVLGIVAGGNEYLLRVEGTMLLALDPDPFDAVPLLPLVDQFLVDANAAIHVHHDDTNEDYYIHFEGFHDDALHTWVAPPVPIRTYRLEWSKTEAPCSTANPCQNVCPLIAPEHPWGVARVEAAFFEKDRYDRVNRTVTEIDDEAGWFNVACAGSAPLKMLAYRHATVTSAGKFQSGKNKRTAMLKMFGADYCGTGKAFTEIGTELRWENAPGWMDLDNPPPPPIDDEAVWNQNGAVCLDTARLADHPDTEDLVDEIDEECATVSRVLEPCSSKAWFPGAWKQHGYVRTANPPL
jgi:ADYC domain